MRYSNINKEKANGVVYTPKSMAEYLAKEMVKYKARGESNTIRILDPAIGKGELVIALLNIISLSYTHIEVVGYETDAEVCVETSAELSRLFPKSRFR